MRRFFYVLFGIMLCITCTAFTACSKAPQKRCSYSITAELAPKERTLSAKMNVTVPNCTETALTELRFELWANAFREGASHKPVSALYAPSVYYAGESYGSITVSEVAGAQSFCVCGEDENILAVTLFEPLYPDEEVSLDMQFQVLLPEANHRFGMGEHNVNLTGFYPVLCAYRNGFSEYAYTENGDPFVSECADYCVQLTVPEAYTAVCGRHAERAVENGKAVYTFSAENVREVAIVLGTELKTLTRTTAFGGREVEVEYAYLTGNAEQALEAAEKSLVFYSERFGEYAYPHYTVVQTDFPYGGMEYPALSMVSCSLTEADVPTVIAHETAHQWWYAAVGSNQYENAWQDEGLAEYSTALFFGAHAEYGTSYESYVERSVKSYRAYFSIRSQLAGEVNTVMNRPLHTFTGAYEYRNIVYDKGVILFDRVRAVAGEKKFFAALKDYYKTFSGRIAGCEELIGCFQSAGCNTKGIFYSFLEGTTVI